MSKVIIYCDGGARRNGEEDNPAGLGVVLQSWQGNELKASKEIYQGYRGKTNNQMEIMAAITALKAMKKKNIPIEIRTDSAYLVNCIQKKWYVKWLNNGWITSSKKPVENRELWIELIDLVKQFPFLTFVKVKGHSGDEGNEKADELANKGMDEVE